jgi:hypothetical protein
MLRPILRRLLPPSLYGQGRRVFRWYRDRWYSRMATEEVFTRAYAKNMWGGNGGTLCSGLGSSHPGITEPYLRAIGQFLEDLPQEQRTVVDLGCGDFRVGEQLAAKSRSYVGVDIVPAVIDELRGRPLPPNVRFELANIVSDQLPDGNICFVRQVLQHLSNAEIARVLPKLRRYRYVIVTEHYPAPSYFEAPNLDHAHGPYIRLEMGSGVYLSEPPFSVSAAAMRLLVEVPGDGSGEDDTLGVLRTFVFAGDAIPPAKEGQGPGAQPVSSQ